MKKIIIIFLLFTLSLFSQVRIEDDTLYIRASENENKNLHCEIVAMEDGTWGIFFIEIDEPIYILQTDNFKYYFKAIEITEIGATTVSLDAETQKKLLKDVINSEYIIVRTETKSYIFYFNRYKKELENNTFYKKLIGM